MAKSSGSFKPGKKTGRGFQPGNKAALGCTTSGAPRTVCPEKDDLIELGKEMVQWVIDNKPFHLSAWWRAHLGLAYSTYKSMIQRKEFIPYHDQAMGLISQNYLNGNVPPAIASRFVRLYFADMCNKEDEDAKADHERKKELIRLSAELKADAQQVISQEVVQGFNSISTQLAILQEASKQRRSQKEESSSHTE